MRNVAVSEEESNIFSLLHTDWWPGWKKGALGHVLSWYSSIYRFECFSMYFSYTPVHSILWLLLFLLLEVVLSSAALFIYLHYYFILNEMWEKYELEVMLQTRRNSKSNYWIRNHCSILIRQIFEGFLYQHQLSWTAISCSAVWSTWMRTWEKKYVSNFVFGATPADVKISWS